MALTPEQQAEISALRAKAASDYNALLESEKRKLIELQNLEQEILGTSESKINATIRQITLLEEQIKLNETLKEIGETTVGAYADNLSQEQNLLDLRKQNLILARQNKDIDEEKFKNQLADLATEQKSLRVKKQGYQDSENFAKRFFGITRQPTSEFGKFLVDPKSRLEGLKKGLGEVIDPMSVLTSTVDKVVEASVKLAFEQDAAVVTFNKATGASGEFDDNIRGLERSLFAAGVTSAEAGQAVQSLFLNVSDFTEMNEQEQRVLGSTVAILNELGIASETAAKNIQFATKVLGQSVNEAVALQRELFVFAQDLGVSANQIAGDFQQMAPQIAAMGKNGVDAFKNLEAQSKSTGLAMTDLLGIVQKFDRFSTAADAVSGLNAILGGPFLNTVELVAETDLSKRFMMFRDAILATGKSFDQLEYFEKKALAAQIGINEAQLAMLMRGNMDQIIPEQKSADELVALQQQTAQFNTVMEELMQTMQALAVSFGPLIGMLKDVLNLVQFLGPVINQMIIPAILNWAVATGRLKLETAALLLPLVIAYQTYVLLTDVLGLSAPVAIAGAVAMGVLTAAMYSFATSTNVAFAGLPALLGGLSMLATGIMIGFSPSVYGALMALGAAFLFLAPVMLPVLGPIAAIVAGFAGMALVVTGLVGLLNSLGDGGLIDNFRIVAEEIANIVESINKLSEEKTVKFTTSMTAMAESFTGNVSSAAMQSVGNGAAMATVPAVANVPQQTSYNGPPPTFNVNVRIGDKDFATAVTDVELTGGINEKLSKSISDMMFSHFYK